MVTSAKTPHNGNNHLVTRYMTTHVPTALPTETLGTVQLRMRNSMQELETLNYIYVVDTEKKLLGVFSIRELYNHPEDTLISSIPFQKKLCTVPVTAHREKAAYLALKHNIKAVPVIDRSGVLMGVIPADAIHSVLYKELREDLMRFAGISKKGTTLVWNVSVWQAIRHRLPWLLIGLFGGLLSASIIGLFENTLMENVLLAAFIPLIVFMNNAVALQMTAYLIRDLAMETDIRFATYFRQQTLIATALACIFGMLIFSISYYMHEDIRTSIVLGIALFTGILTSTITGVLIPYSFSKLKLDPAAASGPLGTITQDILSIVIYFGVATVLL